MYIIYIHVYYIYTCILYIYTHVEYSFLKHNPLEKPKTSLLVFTMNFKKSIIFN